MKINYFVEDGVLMRRDWNEKDEVWDDHYPVNLVDVAHRLSTLDNAKPEDIYERSEFPVTSCNSKLEHGEDPKPHHCVLPAGHEGRHFCYICGLYWDTQNVKDHAHE